MPEVKMTGIDELLRKFSTLERNSQKIIKPALYERAAVALRELKKTTGDLQTSHYDPKNDAPRKYLNHNQKLGLQNSIGVWKMQRSDGKWTVRIGFANYNNLTSKKYLNGQPNLLIARSIEKGTKYNARNDFVGKARKLAQDPAVKAFGKELQEQLNNQFKKS